MFAFFGIKQMLLISLLSFTLWLSPVKSQLTIGDGLTAAQKLAGFSGTYGLGGNLGGLTLNDIAYDLSTSFNKACQQVGIDLGLKIVETAVPIIPTVQILENQKIILDDNILGNVQPLLPEIQPLLEPTIDLKPSDSLVNNGYDFLSFSMGDRLRSKLISPVPYITSKYREQIGPKQVISGYTSEVTHSSKKGSGESRVTFSQLHTEPAQLSSIPELKQRTIVEPSLIETQKFTLGDNILGSVQPLLPEIQPLLEPTIDLKPSDSLVNNGYDFLSFSMGDRLRSKLISPVPYITSKYRQQVISGYTSEVIHSSKKSSGKSRVTFSQLHTEPAQLSSIPELKQRTIVEPSLIESYSSPTTSLYDPGVYQSYLSPKYNIEGNGGYGTLLTGSYGPLLYNQYQNSQYLSNGGFKGLGFFSKKK